MRKFFLMVTLVAAGCGGGGPAETCNQVTCGVAGQSYRVCTVPGTTKVRYEFGSAICNCDSGCADCASQVSTFCSGSGNGNGNTSGNGNGNTSGNGNGNTSACLSGGNACQSFSQCCSGTCANQVCTSCSGSGESCTGGGGCCGGLTCYQNVCGNCHVDGSACNLASDCCSNICHQGLCAACTASGGACTTSAECCNDLACTNGVCGGPDASCLSQDAADCEACCENNYPSGVDSYNQFFNSCVCGPCMSACEANICAASPTNEDVPACDTCWDTTCNSQVSTSCLSDATCAPFLRCSNACPAQ